MTAEPSPSPTPSPSGLPDDAPRILLVDDEPNLLAGLRRQLGRRFPLTTREGGEEALRALREGGLHAVIVADMRMPGMDGAQLLGEVARRHPDVVRLMLTGNADQETAARAVNEGRVHRFLTKPVNTEALAAALDEALETWRARKAERELLERTLAGTVKLLVDLLAASRATSLGRIETMRKVAVPLARTLCPQSLWALDLACLLSDMGLLMAPTDGAREEIAADPASTIAAAELLRRIPRLEPVATLLTGAAEAVLAVERPRPIPGSLITPLAIFQLARDVAAIHPGGDAPLAPALTAALERGDFPESVWAAAEEAFIHGDQRRLEWRTGALPIARLCVGDVVKKEVRTRDGTLLLGADVTLTEVLIARIKSTHAVRPVVEPLTIARAVVAD